jgi:hypothetical protein
MLSTKKLLVFFDSSGFRELHKIIEPQNIAAGLARRNIWGF